MNRAASDAIECRLCGGSAVFRFSRRATDGDDVASYVCTACGSLQTENPYWLAEEYARSGEPDHLNLDTYAADRSLRSRTVAYFLWRLAGFDSARESLLDWGGGVGLMVRLLRDVGVDAYLHDKYARNHYASGFETDGSKRYSVVTAFEVLEHFPRPSEDLQPIFDLRPELLVVTTGIFRGQGPEWPYLGPAKSEHVFFYSPQAMVWIGTRFGYSVMHLRHDLVLFYRPGVSFFRLRLAALLLSRRTLADLIFALLPKPSRCEEDHQKIRSKLAARDRISA